MLMHDESIIPLHFRFLKCFKYATAIWLTAILFGYAGCSLIEPEPVEVAEVKGQVLLDGQPLPGAKVLFIPLDKKLGSRFETSHAITDADGCFELILSDERSGAFVGRHSVMISKAEESTVRNVVELDVIFEFKDSKPDLIPPEIAKDQKDIVPRFYNIETELTFQVVAGQVNNAKFELSSVDPLLKK